MTSSPRDRQRSLGLVGLAAHDCFELAHHPYTRPARGQRLPVSVTDALCSHLSIFATARSCENTHARDEAPHRRPHVREVPKRRTATLRPLAPLAFREQQVTELGATQRQPQLC